MSVPNSAPALTVVAAVTLVAATHVLCIKDLLLVGVQYSVEALGRIAASAIFASTLMRSVDVQI